MLHHHGGKALTGDTIKLAARELLDVPVPPTGPAWDSAAELVRRAHADARGRRALLLEAGAAMIEAYGADPAILAWWERRL